MSDKDDSTTPPEDSEVVERKNVRDVDESDVNSEIDRMLAADEPADDHTDALVDAAEGSTDPDKEQSASEDGAAFSGNNDDPLEGADPANIDPAKLEEQEWTLGGEKGDELIEFKGMQFLLTEPDDDKLLDVIGGEPGEDVSASARMKEMCQLTIEAPTLTDARWENLNIAERLGLMLEVSEYVGLNEFMDFQDVGAEARPGV